MCIHIYLFYLLLADIETSHTSHSRSIIDNMKKSDLESTVIPVNTSTASKEARTASSVTKESDASAIAQSHDVIKRKDNISSTIKNEISTKDTYQSTVKTKNLKAPFT